MNAIPGFDEAQARTRVRADLDARWPRRRSGFEGEGFAELLAFPFVGMFMAAILLFFPMVIIQPTFSTAVGIIVVLGGGGGLIASVVTAAGYVEAEQQEEQNRREQVEKAVARQREEAIAFNETMRVEAEQRKAREHFEGKQRAEREALRALTQAELDAQYGIDRDWEARVKADAARVIAAVRAGQPAGMNDWDATVTAFFPSDGTRLAGQTLVEERQAKREWILWEAQSAIRQERTAMETRQREAVEASRKKRLSKPIPLVPSPRGVVFGTDVETGDDLVLAVDAIPHLLVVGTSGFGKSVFLHQLISQLVTRPEAGELNLVDLKGGVEFDRYARRSDKVHVAGHYDDVKATVSRLIDTMTERQAQMRARGIRTWRGERIFFIVDEFAQVQLWPAVTRDEKDARARLLADLNRLAMLGRAMGIVLVAAIQKPTTDVMDSSFRNNLQGQVCFRVANRLMASTIFPDLDDLPVDPLTLRQGRCLFYNPGTGDLVQLQVHVAPEAAE